MTPVFTRQIAYPKDIQVITGKGARFARSTYNRIKIHYNKPDHQPLTLEDIATYYGLPLEKLHLILLN